MNKTKIYGKEILNCLSKNKIKIVIISANLKKVIEKACRHFNLPYNLIISDEDMPEGTSKKEAIIKVLKKLKLKKNQVFYVGDHISDIIQGKKAGVRVISVTTGVFKANDLKKYNPDYIISNLKEIKEIICQK